jgi:hypothetical protein
MNTYSCIQSARRVVATPTGFERREIAIPHAYLFMQPHPTQSAAIVQTERDCRQKVCADDLRRMATAV